MIGDISEISFFFLYGLGFYMGVTGSPTIARLDLFIIAKFLQNRAAYPGAMDPSGVNGIRFRLDQ